MADAKHDLFFSRVLLMLQKLSREGSANIFDLADEYDVDDRTIRRDVKRLHFFPIEIKKNIVTIVDGYSIEHSKLQDIEFLIAELALSSIEGIDTSIYILYGQNYLTLFFSIHTK